MNTPQKKSTECPGAPIKKVVENVPIESMVSLKKKLNFEQTEFETYLQMNLAAYHERIGR